MKTKFILWISTLSLLLSIGAGCEKNQSICKSCGDEILDSVTNVKGVIFFNSEIKRWYISASNMNGYDSVKIFFPCNLDHEYMENGKTVTFSGLTYRLMLNVTVPAGTTCSCINLTSINKIN